MIHQFVQVRHCSGAPLTPWQVHLINWPFADETFAARRDFEAAMQVAKSVASVRGLPIATPAHVVVSDLVAAAGEAPQGFAYKFWAPWAGDYSDVLPEWQREDWVGE